MVQIYLKLNVPKKMYGGLNPLNRSNGSDERAKKWNGVEVPQVLIP